MIAWGILTYPKRLNSKLLLDFNSDKQNHTRFESVQRQHDSNNCGVYEVFCNCRLMRGDDKIARCDGCHE